MNLHLTVSLCSRCYRRLAGSIAGYHSTSHGHRQVLPCSMWNILHWAFILLIFFYRLVEVGKLEQPQDNGYYQAGQVGVVNAMSLVPKGKWHGQVFHLCNTILHGCLVLTRGWSKVVLVLPSIPFILEKPTWRTQVRHPLFTFVFFYYPVSVPALE